MNEQSLVNLAMNVNSVTCNKTARIIIKGLLADITPEKIAENISIAFDVSYEVVFYDVQLFVQHLMRTNGVGETSSHE